MITTLESEPPHSRRTSITIIKDLHLCWTIWQDFVGGDKLMDNWDFRKHFLQAMDAQPYFITLLKNNNFHGVIPLEYIPAKAKYYAFGGGFWNESNPFYLGNSLSEDELDLLVKNIPRNSEIKFLKKSVGTEGLALLPHENTYYLDIPEDSTNLDFYLDRLSGKSRKKFKQQMHKIEKLGIKFEKVPYSVSSIIESFNVKQFGEESTYKKFKFRKFLENLNTKSYLANFSQNFILSLQGKIVGAAFAVFVDRKFYAMTVGYDNSINNLGKYINYQEIEFARSLGANRIDFFADDCGWKDSWKLQTEMLYQYKPQLQPIPNRYVSVLQEQAVFKSRIG